MEKKNKSVLVFSLLLVLSITSIGIKNGTSATPIIPTPDPPNENVYWDFDAGTFIGWDLGFYNGTTLLMSYELLYNISALTYFINYSGLGINYYGVQLKQAYFNATTNSLEEYPMYPVLNCSMANFTLGNFTGISSFGGYLIVNPFIPVNGSDGLMTEWCAYGLADEYSTFIGGDLNPDVSFPNTNTILFENSNSSGDYVKLVYYDNGTLETAVLFSYGGGYYPEGLSYNYTRIFDFNPIDEVEWDVDIGDEFYMGFRHFEYKYIVVGFVNHSGYGMYGMTAYQSVIADVYRWNILTETWILQSEDFPIASANNDWEYLTQTMMVSGMGGPQLLVPNGTTVDDMLAYFNYLMVSAPPYIELTYGEDYIKIINTTSQEYIFYVEFTSEGIIKYIINKLILLISDPFAMVYYSLNSEVISGMHNFNIEPYGTSDFQVAANITVSEDTHLLYAGMDYNPTNKTLPNTKLVLNVFLNETSNLVGNLNMTITYDHFKYDSLEVWGFNYAADGGMGAWEKIDFIQPVNGKIIISVDHLSLFALVEVLYTPPAAEEIPLEVIIIVSVIGGVVVIAVAVVILMRKKRK